MLTAFGYEVETLDPIVSVETFNEITGGAYEDDPRLETSLSAVSALIRMACRWHVAPSLDCKYTTSASGRLLRLPALAVTAVSKVTEDGQELSQGSYEWRREGLIRRCGFKNWTPTWNGIEIEYQAGFDEVPSEIAELVILRAQGSMALPYGIKSESAGGVSISYMDTGYMGDLSGMEMLTLAPYVLPTEV